MSAVTLGVCMGLWPTDGIAGELALKGGAIVLPQKGLSEKRTIWARGKKLTIVWQASEWTDENLETATHPLIESARIRRRRNRTELELTLREKAEELIARVSISTQGDKLVVKIREPGVAAPSAAVTSTLGTQKIDLDRIPSLNAPVKTPIASKPPEAIPALAPANAGKADRPWKVRSSAKVAGPLTVQTSVNEEPTVNGQTPENTKAYVFGFAGLGLCLAGLFFWWHQRRRTTIGPASAMDLIGSQVLDSKNKVFMVEVGDEVLVLGCGDQGVSLLRSVEKKQSLNHAELDFFAEGDRLNAEAAMDYWAAAPRDRATSPSSTAMSGAYDRAYQDKSLGAGGPGAMATRNLVDHLTREIEGRNLAKTGAPYPVEDASEAPLDEEWAAGILKLRKRRQGQAARDPLGFH